MCILNQGTSAGKPKWNGKVYQALLLQKMSRERQQRTELRRQMLTLVVLRKRFLAWVCLLICPLFQSVEGADISQASSRTTAMLSEHFLSKDSFSRAASSMSWEGWLFSLQNLLCPAPAAAPAHGRQYTCASVCFSPQCIFLLLINRIFNSDTNTFSTSYAQILWIPFTNCAGRRQFFSPWRHNSCKENMRSRKGTGKVSTKALFAYVNKTKQRLTTGLL